MQKFNGSANAAIDAAIRKAMGHTQEAQGQQIPMITDAQGRPIGIPAVAMAVNKNVMAALEEMVRRVISEELLKLMTDSAPVLADEVSGSEAKDGSESQEARP